MKKRKITTGTVDIGELEKKLVNKVLDSTNITQGKYVERFEKMVAEAHNKKYAVMVSSGQNALELALKAMVQAKKIPSNGVIGVPAITYSSTINAVINSGLIPLLIDVDENLKMYHDNKLEKKCDAFLPVHLFGSGYKYPTKRPVIEDACESIFHPKIGYGDITCLSFFASHSICTGEGGMCLTNNKKLYNIMKSIRYHGRTLGTTDFKYERVGTSFKSTELNAALGVAQMIRKKELMRKRVKNGTYLYENLRNISNDLIPLINDPEHKFFMFPILYTGKREKLIKHLHKWGIDTRDLNPIVNQKAYGISKKIQKEFFPMASAFNKHGFYIGNHTKLTQGDLDYIITIFKEFFKK